MKIIGLMGTAGAGKDTVARFLVKNHGFMRVAFADPLKALALELNPEITRYPADGFGITIQEPLAWTVLRLGWERAKQIPEVREYLQNLGVAARDTIHEDVWVDAAFARMNLHDGRYVISDVRFLNEVVKVMNVGGEIWRVDRASVEPPNNHVSEQEWRQVTPHVVVANNGTLQELEQTVTKLWADGA